MTAEKTISPSSVRQQQQQSETTFFRKAGDGFFGAEMSNSFFGSPIQAKLQVSQPDDPQEREADAVADKVMRMSDSPASVDRESDPAIMRLPEAAEPLITAPEAQENELQREAEEEKEDAGPATTLARQIQFGDAPGPVQPKLMREADSSDSASADNSQAFDGEAGDTYIYPKANGPPGSFTIQRSGRAPPAANASFEGRLQSSKGDGAPMGGSTRGFMESRFGADFGQVRIHTGSQAVQMSRDIHAHAFTHGSDIYFNTGRYAPHTAEGNRLLAHELTHTIQQGAVSPTSGSDTAVAPKIQRQRQASIQRVAAERPAPAQLQQAVAKAKGEEGKVNAGTTGPDGYRTGWDRLVEYFKTTLGEDKVLPPGGSYAEGAVSEADIKTKRETKGMPPAHPAVEHKGEYRRDAMPSWCGIFVFWALHKGGVPMKPWGLGGRNVTADAAYPPGHVPQVGDIAYRNNFSHFAIVESASGNTVTTVNGNTAGEDNLGGQVQTKDHPLSDWTAFFDPLMLKDGPLSAGETTAEPEKPLSIRELRKKLFNVDREAESPEQQEEAAPESDAETEQVQTKPELSTWSVDGGGHLQREAAPEEQEEQERESVVTTETVHAKLADRGPQAAPAAQAQTAPGADNAVSSELALDGICLDAELSNPVGDSIQRQSRGPPSIQRSWLGDAWDAVSDVASGVVEWAEDQLNEAKEWILEQARDFVSNIPGYRLLTVILQEDPITRAPVARNGRNMLLAGLDILPLGGIIQTLLERTGAFDEAANFVESRVSDFANMASNIGGRFERFIDGLSLSDIGHPQQVLNDVASLLRDVILEITGFVERSAIEFLSMIKRIMIAQIVGFVRARIPRLYPMLTVALGHDPVTDQEVPRNGTNILNALFDVTDEGREQRAQLQETGTFQKAADWIDRGIHVFTNLYTAIRSGFSLIWDAVSFETLMHPVETFERIYDHFAQPISDVWDFIRDTARIIVQFIKEALLSRLSTWARDQRGYFLITMLIRRDPFTGAAIPFTVENVIRAFMSLMDGGEAQFQQLQESGAIDRTTARVTAAVRRLNFTVPYIVGLFTGLWQSFRLSDLANPIGVFRRIIATFAQPVTRLFNFIVEIVKIVVEVILQVMQFPSDLIASIIARAMEAWDRIKRDPVGFLKNLLRAIKQGFTQFFDNILQHLITGLTGWLMAELRDAGIPELTDFSLRGVISWVLAVLNISMEAIWQKLAQHPRIGPERVARLRGMIDRVEGIWTFIRDVQERGVSAIWERIQEQLTTLWDTIIDSVKNWIMEQIVNRMVTRLLSMLDPTGVMAVINSAIALYSAIQSFIRYLRQILEVINSFVSGVADIAAGNTATAATYLENTMARAMPIVIGFLANQVGLSGIGRRIGEMILRARELVDQALTWLVNRAVDTGFALFDRLLSAGRAAVGGGGTPQERLDNGLRDAQRTVNRFARRRVGRAIIGPLLGAIRLRYGFQTLDVVPAGTKWRIEGQVNPTGGITTDADVAEGPEAAAGTEGSEASAVDAATDEARLNRLIPPAVARAGGELHTGGSREGVAPEDPNTQARGFQRVIARIQGDYARAARSSEDNTMSVVNGRYFVDQARNFYVYTYNMAERSEIIRDGNRKFTTVRDVSGFEYTHFRTVTVGNLYALLNAIRQGSAQSPNDLHTIAILIASLAAETYRYAPAHVTNLILLFGNDRLNDPALQTMAMTRGDTDPQGGPPADHVLDRQLEIVRGHAPLLHLLETLLLNEHRKTDDQLIERMSNIIRNYINQNIR